MTSEKTQGDSFIVDRLYGNNARWLIIAVLVFGCIAVYFQVRGFGFINLDDNDYVYRNPQVIGGLNLESIRWAFQTFHAANWHPLTWLSLESISTLFGTSPTAFHLANLALHVVNSVLVFLLFERLTKSLWKSFLVAAIFAFHPAHVESVAWISEHKDVLSTTFWLLACWFYSRYTTVHKPWDYTAALLLFALGLLAKPMLVTLPFVFLLLDVWPLSRLKDLRWTTIRALLIEKLPFFALSAASSVITFEAQQSGGAVVALSNISFGSRISNAIVSYLWYLSTFFYPIDLGGWYPFEEKGIAAWRIVIAVLVLTAISAYAVNNVKNRSYIFTGWFWFVGTLIPVIGLVQVGKQSHADRYTYIPYIGLSVAIIWLAADILERYKIGPNLIGSTAAIVLAVLAILSFYQVRVWQNSESFYKHTLSVTTGNYLFEQNYCEFLINADRLSEAETLCRNSIENESNYANAWNSLGIIQMKRADYGEAAHDFETASRLRPGNLEMFSNYINALIAAGQLSDAVDKIKLIEGSNVTADVSGPYLFALYRSVGTAFAARGETSPALENLQKANAINPNNADVHKALGLLLYEDGKADACINELKKSLEIDPQQAELHNALGKIFMARGRKDEAISEFKTALQIDPNLKTAADNLSAASSTK